MKKITLLALTFIFTSINAQEKLTTSKCTIYFEASVPLFEAVEAKNYDVECALYPEKSQIVFTAIIKNFQFKRDLMKEHFNSNYMESDRYPKATFKGIIEKFDINFLTDAEKEFKVKGKISIHGQTRVINVIAKIKKTGDDIQFKSEFTLNTDDFNIEVPSNILTKISKNVNTKINCVVN